MYFVSVCFLFFSFFFFVFFFFFFFSSRRRHTRSLCDWSSDVCSSDLAFGLASGDPVNTGSTSLFTSGNFPNSSATQRGDAGLLYALLTGRVTSIGRSATLNGNTGKFEFIPFSEYNHQNEFAVYAQDAWKARPNLTFNFGLRWEFEPSPVNDNNVYTRTGLDGIFGVSGNGNLFKPGVFTGKPTQFSLLQPGEKGFNTRHKDFGPSLGFAWSPNVS